MLLQGPVLLALVVCLDAQGAFGSEEKLVKASLEAKWNHTSFVAETSEFIAREGDEIFWNFIDKIAESVNSNPKEWALDSHEQEYEKSIKHAGEFLTNLRLDLLKFALSLRLFSPKLQVFQQIANEFPAVSRNCAAFVDVNGKLTCSAEEVDALLEDSSSRERSASHSIDHFYGPSRNVSEGLPLAILYADIGTREFSAFHKKLVPLARNRKLQYVLRHFRQNQEDSTAVGLSGYGVELAIKNTEYKAIDDSNVEKDKEDDEAANADVNGFNFNVLKKNNEHLRDSLTQFKIHLSEMEELAPLKQWEVADLSYQAAQKVMEVAPEEALNTLADLSQNFPIRARSLVQTKVKKAFRDEVALNQEHFNKELEISEGESALFLNGINVEVDSLDIFQLFNTISQEESLANAFFGMGFRREYLSVLYNMDLSEDKTIYGIDYREAYPEYINDLDKDKSYRDWGNSVKLLLQPYFPGMIRPIARNLFTMICVLDPIAPDSKSLLKIAHSLFMHQVPLRIGFVFVPDDESTTKSGKDHVGVALLNLYNFAKSDKSPAKAINLLTKALDEFTGDELTVANVHKFFLRHFPDQEVDDVFQADSDYDTGRTAGRAFFKQSGLQSLPKVLLNGVVLDDSSLQADKIEESILMQIMKQTAPLQRAVAMGKLTDKENVQNWILSQPDVLPRLNNRLLREPTRYVPLSDVNPCKAKTSKQFLELKSQERAQCILENSKYLTKSDDEDTKWLTIWLVGDLNSADGRALLQTGLKALKKSNHLRLSYIHNGDRLTNDGLSALKLINSILRRVPSTLAKQMLNKLLASEEGLEQLLKSGDLEKIAVHGVDLDAFKKALIPNNDEQLALQRIFAEQDLHLGKGESAVVVNGMLYGPFEANENFEVQDFFLLEKIMERKGAKAVGAQIDEWGVSKENGKSSDVVMRSIAVVGRYATKKKRQFIDFAGDSESVVTLLAEDGSRPVIEIVGIVDPLSRNAQKLATVLLKLSNVLNCDLKLVMNPKGRLSELPLKRFYRYVLQEAPQFNSQGRLLAPSVSFKDLPAKQLLTLNVIAPNSWMVQPVFAEYDLDNIMMKTAKKDVIARFELVHILLEGHCFDEVTGNPPRGLQYILGTKNNPSQYDTIVMANLGYFQLKASPGAWTLKLRDGKSKEIYEIKVCSESEGQDDEKTNVLIDSFLGKTVRIRVAKRAGMDGQTLLNDGNSDSAADEEEEGDGNSLWSSISSKLAGGEKHDKINIFSLASGHLYERFIKIMILSVMKNTKHPVKFWLLNNYLSPNFRQILPKMADKYQFEFELIEYKWPRWLHQQTEKQRVMWGYKILFLDVLFPLDVKKIIFVDADQVIRTDMMELMNLDLGGAPYGYVPFCESRTTMDGFRFWKQGYWANHLAGRRYHISALYVVDLVKFRQIAAGDRLRGQYQGLSSDPNSLSNLDQDLPNNMIHQVRIKSLPQEWLWCETWCDDASKKDAKTIDLCNNPQTKEPKLDSAMRIIPEWTAYDNEIKKVMQEAGDAMIPEPETTTTQEQGEEKHGGEL